MSAAVEAYDCLIVSSGWSHSTLLCNKKGNNITIQADKVRDKSVPIVYTEGGAGGARVEGGKKFRDSSAVFPSNVEQGGKGTSSSG